MTFKKENCNTSSSSSTSDINAASAATTTTTEETSKAAPNECCWSQDYTLACEHSIGRGSFGKVKLVRCKRTGKYFAMKEIDLRQVILRGAGNVNRRYALDEGNKPLLRHANLVHYYASYLYNESVFWLMEYCDGGTLRDHLRLYAKRDKRLDERLVWYWTLHVLRGLQYMHSRGVIHRDLKPDNIYIESRRGTCKIGDFGFAKQVQVKQEMHQESDEEDEAEHVVMLYQLVKMSQVGTPAYMAPEFRRLIEAHLTYESIATVENALAVCELNVFKGDVFSFGCIVYEMLTLKTAFENRFMLPAAELFDTARKRLDKHSGGYSGELRDLVTLALTQDAFARPDVQALSQQVTKRHAAEDYADAYRAQVTPCLTLNSDFAKHNTLVCVKDRIVEHYKPIAMKSLKFNQNLIVILANKHVNVKSSGKRPTVDDGDVADSKILIYSEFCHMLKDFDSYLVAENSARRASFNFMLYDFCVDEDRDHIYVSTRKYGILRFRIVQTNYYFEDLVLEGRLDFSELSEVATTTTTSTKIIFPTCLNLLEADTVKNKRRLVFLDRLSNRLISATVDTSNVPSASIETLIRCNISVGVTLDQPHMRQMVCAGDELVCLFSDIVNVYNARTMHLLRSNKSGEAESCSSKQTLKNNICCLTHDSDHCVYSTDGRSIFNYDTREFKSLKRLRLSLGSGENLCHTITLMSILTNGKLVLLTDAVQMESSVLFILKPVTKNSLTTNVTTE